MLEKAAQSQETPETPIEPYNISALNVVESSEPETNLETEIEELNAPDSNAILEAAAKELLEQNKSNENVITENNDVLTDTDIDLVEDDFLNEPPSHSTDIQDSVAYNKVFGPHNNNELNIAMQNPSARDNFTDNDFKKEESKQRRERFANSVRLMVINSANANFNKYDGLSHEELQKIRAEFYEEKQELNTNLKQLEAEIDSLEEERDALQEKVPMHNGQPVYQSEGITGYLYTKGPNGEIQKLSPREEDKIRRETEGDLVTQDEVDAKQNRIDKLKDDCCSIEDRLAEIQDEEAKLADAQDRLNSPKVQGEIKNFIALDDRARDILVNNTERLIALELSQAQATDPEEIERLTQEINELQQQQENLTAYRSMMNTEQVAASEKFIDGLDHYKKAIELVGEDPDLMAEFNSYRTNYWNEFKNRVYGQTPDYLRNDFITHDLGGDAQIWAENFVTNDSLFDFTKPFTFEGDESPLGTGLLASDTTTSFDTSSPFQPTATSYASGIDGSNFTTDANLSSAFHTAVAAEDLLNTAKSTAPELLSANEAKHPDSSLKEQPQTHTHCSSLTC